MLKDTNLITVKTLTSKMAKQIRCPALTEDLYKRLSYEVVNEASKDAGRTYSVVVHGWVQGTAIDRDMWDDWKLLLVQEKSDLYFLLWDTSKAIPPDCKQLFIS